MDLPTSDPLELNFRKNFEEKLIEYDEHHQGSQRKPWTQKRVLEVINNVKSAKMSKTTGERRSTMDYYWKNKYSVMTVSNKDYLINKKKNTNDPTVHIIPREQYFDVLLEIHKSCAHGGRDKMLQETKTKFYIPKKCIELFVSLCPTCETKRNNPKKNTLVRTIDSVVTQDVNIRRQVELNNSQSCSEGNYQSNDYSNNDINTSSYQPLTSPGVSHNSNEDDQNCEILNPLETSSTSQKLYKRILSSEEEDLIMEKAIKLITKPDDEFQVFGDFVAEELRALRSYKNKSTLKRLIQKAIIEISEADDNEDSSSPLPLSP